jgi:hypothetical protein
MPTPEEQHSVFNEPHLKPGGHRPDPSEQKADRTLASNKSQSAATYDGKQSVYDEPDILPDRPSETITQDWTCDQCGYNLRGLTVGHICPECGHIERYRPAPPGQTSYREWLQDKQANQSKRKAWLYALLAGIIGGITSIAAPFLGTEPIGLAGLSMLVIIVIYGPLVEETMKIAAAAYMVEVRPYLFRNPKQILLATLGAALLFAAIENLIYLNIYFPNPTIEMQLWRWIACTALHLACTYLAATGLIAVWSRATHEYRQPRITDALPKLILAAICHGLYNAGATAFETLT